MYRDPERAGHAAFAQHVQIAETFFVINLEQLERLARRWDATLRGDYASSWRLMWEQLDAARAIAVARGRDVTAIDRARRRGNPLASDFAISRGHREAALRAFADVRRCLPEVVVPTEIPRSLREPERPRAAWVGWVFAMVIALLVLAFARDC